MDLVIRQLASTDELQARVADDELVAEGSEFLASTVPDEPWSDYLRRLEALRCGRGLSPGQVSETCLVGEADGDLVGMVRVRHALTPRLRRMGGHIGYVVRPAHRRRRYGAALLRHGLGVAAGLGIDSALLTCSDDNAASIAMIERAGGVLDDVIDVPGFGRKRRYWIPTGAAR